MSLHPRHPGGPEATDEKPARHEQEREEARPAVDLLGPPGVADQRSGRRPPGRPPTSVPAQHRTAAGRRPVRRRRAPRRPAGSGPAACGHVGYRVTAATGSSAGATRPSVVAGDGDRRGVERGLPLTGSPRGPPGALSPAAPPGPPTRSVASTRGRRPAEGEGDGGGPPGTGDVPHRHDPQARGDDPARGGLRLQVGDGHAGLAERGDERVRRRQRRRVGADHEALVGEPDRLPVHRDPGDNERGAASPRSAPGAWLTVAELSTVAIWSGPAVIPSKRLPARAVTGAALSATRASARLAIILMSPPNSLVRAEASDESLARCWPAAGRTGRTPRAARVWPGGGRRR